MQPQTILADPVRAIEERWGSANSCPHEAQVHALVAEIKRLKPDIKRLKNLKREYSREFGAGSLNELQRDQLKQKVGAVAGQIKQHESGLKAALASLGGLFEPDSQPSTLPPRYQPRASRTGPARADKLAIATDVLARPWDDYVADHPQATIYHRYGWKHALQSAQHAEGTYLVALDTNEKIVGVLPTFALRSRLFGNFLVSVPYVNYGGPLANSPEIECQLLEQAAVIAAGQGAQHFEARSMREVNNWPKKSDKVSMLLSLPSKSTLLDQQLGSKLRAQLKQARQHNLQTVFGHSEILNDFYTVFARNMRDLGTPVYGKVFFQTILEAFPESSTLVVTYKDSKAVAAGFLLAHDNTLEIPWASALRAYNRFNANMFMYKSILDHAIAQGFEWFDFGRSTIDAPTFKFKKQWGAQPVKHYWHYWLADGESLPALNPDNPKYQLAIKVWQKLPVWLTKIIGPAIVKKLP